MQVVTLPVATVDGFTLPVIPGAVLIKQEGDSGYYSAHFTPVSRRWIILYQFAPGRFAAEANDPGLLSELPAGVQWADFLASPGVVDWRTWRVGGTDARGAFAGRVATFSGKVPRARPGVRWSLDGMTINDALPTLPSVCAQRDPAAYLQALENA